MSWLAAAPGSAALGFVVLAVALRRHSLALVGLGLAVAAVAGAAPRGPATPVAVGGALGAVAASEVSRWLIDARRRGGRVSIEGAVVRRAAAASPSPPWRRWPPDCWSLRWRAGVDAPACGSVLPWPGGAGLGSGARALAGLGRSRWWLAAGPHVAVAD